MIGKFSVVWKQDAWISTQCQVEGSGNPFFRSTGQGHRSTCFGFLIGQDMCQNLKTFFFAYGPYSGHFTLKPQPSLLVSSMIWIWDQGSNLLFAKHPDHLPCSRSANTSYILATSCDSILERCGIYHNLHLLFMLGKPSMTEAINSYPGFIPAHLAVLFWVLRSPPPLSPARIWLRLQRRSRFRNYIVLIWMVNDFDLFLHRAWRNW